MPRDNLEAFLHCRVEALESWSAYDVAGVTASEGADSGGLEDGSLKIRAGTAELVRQVWRARVHVVLIARSGADSLAELRRHAGREPHI